MSNSDKRSRANRVWKSLPQKTKGAAIVAQERADKLLAEAGLSSTIDTVIRTTEAQARGARNVTVLGQWAEEHGGFVFALFKGCETFVERFPSLSQSDYARVMFLGTYTSYDGGRLQHDNGRPIKRAGLADLLGMHRVRYSELHRKLVAESIISEDEETGDLYMNPSIFYRGEIKKENTYDLSEYRYICMFRNTVRSLYETYGKGREVKQLAILYAVLPFINFNTNIVCFNPEETQEDRLQPMDVERLAALLGYKDAQKLRKALDAVKLNGKNVFLLVPDVHDKRKRRVIVNPRVVFAGSAEKLAAIKVLFN
ncbi:hypothetical protein [Paenibacillus polymyxa]|uniref:Uncharacterized protein n=1 Tax=Paenibacillus polymyxa TaxID=1406 RepID=A0AAE9IEX2_PAEPO|nr:hypothetical protein [Paenibacillus polymyxa]URJ51253.1 hypothetical protein MF626_000660 [Paenibacillus polymyxa]